MKRASLIFALLAALAPTVAHAWPHEGRGVGPGLIYRRFSGNIEIPGSGTSTQEIFVVYVDTLDPSVRFVASAEADRGLTVSGFAERHGLAVAINTNFFDGSRQSCGLMAGMGGVWGASYDAGGSCADSIGVTPGNEVVVFRSEGLRLGPLPDRVSEVATGMPFVVRSGGVVDQSVIESPPNPSHMGTANPRTAVCLHSDLRTLVFVVVDGRATGRTGMRGITLGRFLHHVLGCVEGLNLDGGGSSAMFVRGEPGFEGRPAGVVNRTSDGTERGVCCHLGVRVGDPAPLFAAELVDRAPDREARPGEALELFATWRNVGRRAWAPDGPWPLRLGTSEPRDRTSVFDPGTWSSASRVANVGGVIAPGAEARFAIPLVAPSTSGTYDEAFELVAESATWLDGPARFRITVAEPPPPPIDAGIVEVDAGVVRDASSEPRDAGQERDGGVDERTLQGSCACRAGAAKGSSRNAWMVFALVLAVVVRRARR
jgi:MYXO-CTERM domain-containing protein